MRIRRIVFDWQMWLIALAAIASWLLAYDTGLATLELLLIAFGIAVYLVMANLPDPMQWRGRRRSALAATLAALPAIIAAYFLLTNDWARWIGKLSIFDPILSMLAAWQPSLIGWDVNPNVIGGSVAALIPLQIYALRNARRWLAVILIGLSSVALLLSQTRGAWLALALVTGMWLLWRFMTARQSQVRYARWMWMSVVVVVGLAGLVILTVTPLGQWLLGLGGDRTQIWRNSLDLVGDYPLTGFGLGDFEMTYSTYVLLIHVGHTMHAHNLWLNVWLNLGLLGVLALLGMTVNAMWPKPSSPWRMAALMTLGVLLLHTLADDSIFGYGGIGIPIIFVPLGLLARSSGENMLQATSKHRRLQPAIGVWCTALIALIIGLITPQGRAAAEANIGTLLQTRTELSVYSWPTWRLQDEVRRAYPDDLEIALQWFENGVKIDPQNAVSHRHLGQIQLSLGKYDDACLHLEAAYAAAPQQRATRQLLGECYALSNHIPEAVALWQTVDTEQAQLRIRRWWYEEYLRDSERTAKFNRAVDVLANQ